MPKNSTIATLLVSTAAAGLSGAVIAGAADSSKTASSSSTATDTRPATGYPGGPGGHRGGPGGLGRGGFGAEAAAVAKTLGVTEAELKKAVQAARPTKDSGAAKPDKADRLEATAAALAKELDESTAEVQAVIESLRPAAGTRPDRGDKPSGTTPSATTPPAGDRGGHGGPGRGGFARNETALVTALAKKFSISEAKAQAAVDAVQKSHEAEHAAREQAFYAAVAKLLGKSADDVQKAFEAARPAKPTTK